MEIKCKHCCKSLFKGDSILFNAHYEVIRHAADIGCQTDGPNYCSYMTTENIPSWIMDLIDQVYFFN
jgi:hypothetical protein